MKKALLIVMSIALIGSSAVLAQGQTKRFAKPSRGNQMCMCDWAEILGVKAAPKQRKTASFDRGTLPPVAKTQKRNR